MNAKVEKMWVEKARPKSVKDVIMTSESHRIKFDSYVEKGVCPNLLLVGGPGTGKTSVSKALVRDLKVDRTDRIIVFCSDEKIDAIRSRVKAFATTMPLGAFKIVQLEEFDNIGVDAQKLLRSLIEETSDTVRYIATCNYPQQLIPPLRSRFQEFSFSAPSLEEVTVRSAEILMNENIEFELDVLDQIVAVAYPDFRKVIQLLEACSINGKLVLDKTAESVSDWKLQLLDLIAKKDFNTARKVVCTSAGKEELIDVYRFLYTHMHRTGLTVDDLGQAYILIAQYQYQHSFVADPELQIAALFIELSLIG